MNEKFLESKPDMYETVEKIQQYGTVGAKWMIRNRMYGMAMHAKLDPQVYRDRLLRIAVKMNRRLTSPQSYLWRQYSKSLGRIAGLEEINEFQQARNNRWWYKLGCKLFERKHDEIS